MKHRQKMPTAPLPWLLQLGYRPVPDVIWRRLVCVLVVLCVSILMSPPRLLADDGTLPAQVIVTHEVHYQLPSASEVFLVWQADGHVIAEALRPPGTAVHDGAMHTPMQAVDGTFVAKLQVPAGTLLTYAFHITKTRNGMAVDVWDDAAPLQDGYHSVALSGGSTTVSASLKLRGEPLISQEIRYHLDWAKEVYLIWGVDGWQVLPEAQRPPGTAVQDAVMHTPMQQQGDTFVARVSVPAGTVIDYDFLITRTDSGQSIEMWDRNGETLRHYRTVARTWSTAEVRSKLTPPGPLQEPQEIRYLMPDAGEVYLVWRINEWYAFPELKRPPGTILKDTGMHTPMQRQGNTFVATVYVPPGSTISYDFLITRTRSGKSIEVWDRNGKKLRHYRTVARAWRAAEVQSKLTLSEAPLVSQEIRYGMPEASKVYLVWGINRWQVLPEAQRPPGTVVQDAVMHTPMQRQGDTFVATVHVPPGTTIDYGFLTTEILPDIPVYLWKINGNQDFHTIPFQDEVVEVPTRLSRSQTQEASGSLPINLHVVVGIGFVLCTALYLSHTLRRTSRSRL